jgi:hypothetical protein
MNDRQRHAPIGLVCIALAVGSNDHDSSTFYPGEFPPMSKDDFDAVPGIPHDHDHEHGHDHGDEPQHEHEVEEALEEALELDTQSQIFLEMRRQNLDLLKIATQVAGYTGQNGPLKPGDIKTALRGVWDIFSEFYTWIDPEEAEDDHEESDGDEDEE